MEEKKAKELVVKAGIELVKSGLIARTWGNVSCRLDDTTFVITPSGRAYESLTPDEIVVCKTEDASYDGDIKPSSERGAHALIYRERPEANFIIHTHQTQASAVSVIGKAEMPAVFSSEGEPVPVAEYGLPGTKKLCKGIEKALSKTRGRAVIMAHHGVICFGKDEKEAFDAANSLEKSCRDYIKDLFKKAVEGKYACSETHRCLFAGDDFGQDENCRKPASSRRTDRGFVFSLDGKETEYAAEQNELPPEAALHAGIFRRRRDVNFIVCSDSAALLTASASKMSLLPMLDDFAQIEGRHAYCSKSAAPSDVVRALGKRSGVLVTGVGALCCGANESDANAVQLVMEKNAYAQITAELCGSPHELSFSDCLIMRTVYKLSYSKKK